MSVDRKFWILAEEALLNTLHDYALDRQDRLEMIDRGMAGNLVFAVLDALGLWEDGYMAVGVEAIATVEPSAAMGRSATASAPCAVALADHACATAQDSIAVGPAETALKEGAIAINVKWLIEDLRRRKQLACEFCTGAGGSVDGLCGHCGGTGDRDQSCTYPECDHEPRVQ